MAKSLAVIVGMINVMSVNVNEVDGLTNVSKDKDKFIEYKMEGNEYLREYIFL